ncbi:unnamed protein product, partial [Prorocentrum cordatum]
MGALASRAASVVPTGAAGEVPRSPLPDDVAGRVRRCASARDGLMEELQELKDRGMWNPRNPSHAKIAICAAEASGHVLRLLGTFDMMVSRALAAPYFENATSQLRKGLNRSETPSLKNWTPPLDFFPTLLANFIRVDHPAVDDMMEKLVVEKQMLLTSTEGDFEATALTPTINFPEHLGMLYIFRDPNLERTKEFEFDPAAKVVTYDNREAYTSDVAKITLPKEDRRVALIPENATRFAYVYSCDWLKDGGFLYVDDQDIVRGVNALSFEEGFFGFQFKAPEKLKQVDEIMKPVDG